MITALGGGGLAADGTGRALIGVAALVVIANALMRPGLSSERDRRAEQEARRHLDRTGRWPM
jgi:hypothetical protein